MTLRSVLRGELLDLPPAGLNPVERTTEPLKIALKNLQANSHVWRTIEIVRVKGCAVPPFNTRISR
jgi:hypothetical protein